MHRPVGFNICPIIGRLSNLIGCPNNRIRCKLKSLQPMPPAPEAFGQNLLPGSVPRHTRVGGPAPTKEIRTHGEETPKNVSTERSASRARKPPIWRGVLWLTAQWRCRNFMMSCKSSWGGATAICITLRHMVKRLAPPDPEFDFEGVRDESKGQAGPASTA